MGHNIQRVAVCIWYYLDINRVIQLLLEEWEWIWRGCFEPYMRAIYSTNDIWRYNRNGALDLYLLVSSVWERYVLGLDDMNCFQYSRKHTVKEDRKAWPVSYDSLKWSCDQKSECVEVWRHRICVSPSLRLQVIAQIHKQYSWQSGAESTRSSQGFYGLN